ncbi:MAG: Flp pilus assembly protein CpaB [Cohnella sp.]|nr:Flp pilus assembly protein CpaB [Cohnella sp.]
MRSKIILIAALLMGAATTLLFFNYTKQYKEAPAIANDKLVDVVAVKQDLRENTILTSSMLEVKKIPESGVHPQTVRNPQDAVGKLSSADLTAGEALLATRIKDRRDEALFVSKKIREGYRAASVGVNIVQSVSNLIEPNDYVDVVYNKKDKDTGRMDSHILLENVHVLAIARRMVEAVPETPVEEFAQVTLELLPADGIKLISADEDSDVTLSMMLHSRVVEQEKAK